LIKLSRHTIRFCFFLLCLWISAAVNAQTDSLLKPVDSLTRVADTVKPGKLTPADSLNKKKDTVKKNQSLVDTTFKNHDPKIATRRSLILPGWGQVYNKRIWKVPIIYGALITTGVVFFYNMNTYRELRFAYKARIEASTPPFDSTNYNTLAEIYQRYDINSIKTSRNEFRQNIDFSVLAFLLFWGLNVVDATVDAHLRTFDVSPDLSFHIKAGHSDMANTTGLRFILAFK
jgi:Family of unknown function (DUF5683)